MGLLELPIWGQLSILALSIGLNVWFVIRIATGALVPYNRVEEANKNTDRWQHAWEVSEQTKREATDLVAQLTVNSQTMEKVLNALPSVQVAHVIVKHDGEEGAG